MNQRSFEGRPYPVIVALDDVSRERAIAIARQLSGRVWGFKVHSLVTQYGFGIIDMLKPFGRVFLDMKYHDIPRAIAGHVRAAVQRGVDLISVHASDRDSGEMLRNAVSEGGGRVVAITKLTSSPSGEEVVEIAQRAYAAGVDTVVCSAHEARAVKKALPKIKVITPAIRAIGAETHDQSRVSTPEEALSAGADLLVVGQPITGANDPLVALESLIRPSLSKASAPLSIVPRHHE
jgi:orotidine-5'-phosphate decarboxylase